MYSVYNLNSVYILYSVISLVFLRISGPLLSAGLVSQKPNLMLTGSGIPARGEQEHEIGGSDKRRHNSGFQLNTADENSFEEVTEIDPRWGR